MHQKFFIARKKWLYEVTVMMTIQFPNSNFLIFYVYSVNMEPIASKAGKSDLFIIYYFCIKQRL